MPKTKIDVKKWRGKEIQPSLIAIMKELGGAQIKREVTLKNEGWVKNENDNSVFQYPNTPGMVSASEAVELTDGRIFMTCSVSEYTGTFAEHNDVAIKHFILTKN